MKFNFIILKNQHIISENNIQMIKLLIVPSDYQGVGHFRSIWPAQEIQKNNSDKFEVEIEAAVGLGTIDFLKTFDIIHYHRQIGPIYEEQEELHKQLKAAGVILIMDIDDYWDAPTTHPIYEIAKKEKLNEKILSNIKRADYVTTTTDIFASRIRPYNKNVLVIPNAIKIDHPMWQDEDVKKDDNKCRIIWIGGSSHMYDLALLEKGIGDVYYNKSLEDKFQFVMCGFDTRGTITEIRPDGSHNVRKIFPHETIWNNFESIFTNKFCQESKDEEYFKWLKKIKKESYPNEYKKSYVRRWTLPLTQYGKHYNYGDVCLAPIAKIERYKELKENREIVAEHDHRPGTVRTREHTFNLVKSELKIIEAGMKKKVLIAQDFGIYKSLLEHGKTGFLVTDDDKDWYKYMKKMILEPELRKEIAQNLYDFVVEKYDIVNVTSKRCELYEDILNKHKLGHVAIDSVVSQSV